MTWWWTWILDINKVVDDVADIVDMVLDKEVDKVSD